jgi:hypothetical protein
VLEDSVEEVLGSLLAGSLRIWAGGPRTRRSALLFRAELGVRPGDLNVATESLAAAHALDLSSEDRAALNEDFAHAEELVRAATAYQ